MDDNDTPLPALPLTWERRVPLINSPVILRQLGAVWLISFLLLSLLLSGIFALEGDWSGIPPTLTVLALVHGGLFLGSLAVMLLYFGNRIAMAFSLDKRGAHAAILEKRARRANQLATLMGLATGNLAVAGAGMLANSGARSFIPWKQVKRLSFDERHHTIHLCNEWRTLSALFCTPENYAAAKVLVKSRCGMPSADS